jgi:hypothetical protein
MKFIETPNQLDQGEAIMNTERELTEDELEAVSGGIKDFSFGVVGGYKTAASEGWGNYKTAQAEGYGN